MCLGTLFNVMYVINVVIKLTITCSDVVISVSWKKITNNRRRCFTRQEEETWESEMIITIFLVLLKLCIYVVRHIYTI